MRNDYAAQYGELQQWHWWFRGRNKIIGAVFEREFAGAPGAPRSILSVGCGPAVGLGWLVPHAGRGGRVVGLDIDPVHARNLPEGVEFVVGSLESAPFPDASFDAVLALDVLEHLDDAARGLREALRMVRPGGLLLVTVPALPLLWGGQDVVSEHRRRYTKGSLEGLFREAGLSGYRVKYFNTLLFPLVASVRISRRVLGQADRPRSDFEDNRPGLLNDLLERVFGAESLLINRVPMPIGVSLVATYRPAAAGRGEATAGEAEKAVAGAAR